MAIRDRSTVLNPDSKLTQLLTAPTRPGRVVWIGLRAARRAPVRAVEAAVAEADSGLLGDHYGRRHGSRQVTLVQAEDLAAIASYLGQREVDPALLRRNIVTQGINLRALKGRRFRIGSVVLEHTGECHPCSRLEEALGTGGYNAVRGHGGITARVLSGGELRIGEEVEAT
ncbi:MAG TPA: MOSC domain-containing protein [Burkholderiaceae bacterium]|nr:MOSC domain-containing protein [Burkholderiaceae bacterium]